MTQFQQEMTKNNLTEENLPNYLKKKISQYEQVVNYRQSQIDEFSSLETDEEKQETTEVIESADLKLEELDEEITDMIKDYVVGNQPKKQDQTETKKSSGNLLLWGGLGLIGLLVGVNVFKNRE